MQNEGKKCIFHKLVDSVKVLGENKQYMQKISIN